MQLLTKIIHFGRFPSLFTAEIRSNSFDNNKISSCSLITQVKFFFCWLQSAWNCIRSYKIVNSNWTLNAVAAVLQATNRLMSVLHIQAISIFILWDEWEREGARWLINHDKIFAISLSALIDFASIGSFQ